MVVGLLPEWLMLCNILITNKMFVHLVVISHRDVFLHECVCGYKYALYMCVYSAYIYFYMFEHILI